MIKEEVIKKRDLKVSSCWSNKSHWKENVLPEIITIMADILKCRYDEVWDKTIIDFQALYNEQEREWFKEIWFKSALENKEISDISQIDHIEIKYPCDLEIAKYDNT